VDAGRVSMFEYQCKIVRVIDGDTTDVDIDLGFGVWMKKQRVRFYGVDTPESRTSDKEEKVYGLMAKEFVKSYLPKGSTQVLRTHKDGVGKYGRILGEFVVYDVGHDRETTVNQLLIDTYNAVEYFGQSKDDIIEGHLINRARVVSPPVIV
jgi:micrococcal nuclease